MRKNDKNLNTNIASDFKKRLSYKSRHRKKYIFCFTLPQLILVLIVTILVSIITGILITYDTYRNVIDEYESSPSGGVGRVCTVNEISDVNKIVPISTVENNLKYFDVPLDTEIQDYIINLCNNTYTNIDPELVIALISRESNFDINAKSNTNDYGICQINEINFEWLTEELGITDIMDPYQNILCCMHILSDHLYNTNGNIEKALMCYNQGPRSAKNSWNNGIYSTDYSNFIYNEYLKLLA